MRFVLCGIALGFAVTAALGADAPKAYPTFGIDPAWPKQLPDNFIMGDPGGIGIDAQDHVWVITRQRALDNSGYLGAEKMQPTSECCRRAPAVIEFDPEGNFIQGWGGPYSPTDTAARFDWPATEHGLSPDYKGNLWICGGGKDAKAVNDNQCLKFSRTGKFLLQIGHAGKSKGSLDLENLNHPSEVWVWQKTNEVFIADGSVNRRVAVFDNDTGKFKRMWGAYGKAPDDKASRERTFEDPPPQQFNQVHAVKIANDGLVYVGDGLNNRIQVFTLDGKFIKEAFIHRDTRDAGGTVASLAFSADPEQRFLYDADPANFKVRVLDRQTLQEIPQAAFGHAGPYAGQFKDLHIIATDSKGNLYTTEAAGGRVQKWAYKGLSQ